MKQSITAKLLNIPTKLISVAEKKADADASELDEGQFVDRRRPANYHYMCPACTNPAAYAFEPMEFVSIICPFCGHEVEYKAENWVKRDPEQPIKISRVTIPTQRQLFIKRKGVIYHAKINEQTKPGSSNKGASKSS